MSGAEWRGPERATQALADLELSYTPATRLAEMIGRKEISPTAVVRNSLDRIEEVNPSLNCFCFTYPQEALERARAAEAAVMAGEDLWPPTGPASIHPAIQLPSSQRASCHPVCQQLDPELLQDSRITPKT